MYIKYVHVKQKQFNKKKKFCKIKNFCNFFLNDNLFKCRKLKVFIVLFSK